MTKGRKSVSPSTDAYEDMIFNSLLRFQRLLPLQSTYYVGLLTGSVPDRTILILASKAPIPTLGPS